MNKKMSNAITYDDVAESKDDIALEESAVSNVKARAVRSVSDAQQILYVVDGVPYDGDISEINPNSIASTTVLKEAQATGGNSKGGATGNHSLVVKQLAQSQTVATRSFANADAVVGGGTLRIQMGSVNEDGTSFTADGERKALEITIPENATVKDIRDIINRSNSR